MSDIKVSIDDDFYEHWTGDDKSQALVQSITGTTEAAPSQENDVAAIQRTRKIREKTAHELSRAMNLAGKDISRVAAASGECIIRTIEIPVGATQELCPTVKLCSYNYERSRLTILPSLLSGFGGSAANPQIIAFASDPNIMLDSAIGLMPSNAFVMSISPSTAGTGVFMSRPQSLELHTIRDLSVKADPIAAPGRRCWVSIIEEFVA